MEVYIDTSVIGGCFDENFEVYSKALFREFKIGIKTAVISDIILEELENAPEKVKKVLLDIPGKFKKTILLNDEAIDLANKYIEEKAITKKFYNDALHIALVSVNKIDLLASWNFKHIVNLNRIRLYNSVNIKMGYPIIEIRSPQEVLYEKL